MVTLQQCDADVSAQRAMRLIEPRTANQLHAYVRVVLGFHMPRRPMVAGHASPFDYLCHAFFESEGDTPRDCVVWANRGGGKTQVGAIATLLDMLFKPGIEIRILGGSFDQSSRMHRHLRRLLDNDVMRDLVDGRITERSVRLVNGSRVEVLSQSQRAVRGQRVHRLRCDEVELFDESIWQAAQLTTRSGWCGGHFVRASIEALSTMHEPLGLMSRLVESTAEPASRRLFRWSVLDTLARCPDERPCESCALVEHCRGRAKDDRGPRGFVSIDDAIDQLGRVDDEVWQAEMLCHRPSRSHAVYPSFDPDAHVRPFDVDVHNGLTDVATESGVTWLGGIDFGYRDPTVLLWAAVWVDADGSDVLHVVDELVSREETCEQHIRAADARLWPKPRWIGADPAGHQRSEQTGRSVISHWRRAGWLMRTRRASVMQGIAAVRRRLKAADGSVTLRIDPRCRSLIQSLTSYRFPKDRPQANEPVKDGSDHAADALRYLVVNLDGSAGRVESRLY